MKCKSLVRAPVPRSPVTLGTGAPSIYVPARFVYMVYASPFYQMTAEGTFNPGSTTEIWRCTFKFPVYTGVPVTPTSSLAFLTAASSAVKDYHQTSGTKAGSTTYLTALSGATIGTDGKYLLGSAQETVRYTLPVAAPGGGTAIHSNSAAMCISFRTTRARGRASRGRVYWPARAVTVAAADGLVATADIAIMATAARTMVDLVNGHATTHLGPTSYLSVMSAVGSGTVGMVTAISLGRKMDHMESREGELSESHLWVDLASNRDAAERERRRIYDQAVEEAGILPDRSFTTA